MAALESRANLRQLDTDASQLDKIVVPAHELNRAIMQELKSMSARHGILRTRHTYPHDIASKVDLAGNGMLDELLRRHVRLPVISTSILVPAERYPRHQLTLSTTTFSHTELSNRASR